MVFGPNSFDQKSNAMKTGKSKKLNKHIDTICDFKDHIAIVPGNETTTGQDTTATMTIIITTINTHLTPQKLTV